MTLAANKHVRGQREMYWKDMFISMLMMPSWRQAARKVMHQGYKILFGLLATNRLWYTSKMALTNFIERYRAANSFVHRT